MSSEEVDEDEIVVEEEEEEEEEPEPEEESEDEACEWVECDNCKREYRTKYNGGNDKKESMCPYCLVENLIDIRRKKREEDIKRKEAQDRHIDCDECSSTLYYADGQVNQCEGCDLSEGENDIICDVCSRWHEGCPQHPSCYYRIMKKEIRKKLVAPPCSVCKKEIRQYPDFVDAVICTMCDSLVHHQDGCRCFTYLNRLVCSICYNSPGFVSKVSEKRQRKK